VRGIAEADGQWGRGVHPAALYFGGSFTYEAASERDCHLLHVGGGSVKIEEDPMAYDIPPPEQRPEPGYYYHYKHDPNGPLNNYAYYIYGIGHHTEDDCRPEDAFMQVYRPLYAAYAYRNGGMFDLRPLHMFYEPVKLNGKEVQRFTKITDPVVIAQLQAIKARMYPNP
jgi:hypothetical protein